MKLQIASLDSVPDVVQLVNSAFRGDSSRRGWTTEADLLGGQRVDAEMVSEMVQNPNLCLLLLRSEAGELSACLNLENLPKGHLARVGMITVRPTEQGKGVGRQILANAESWAREQWGTRAMEMTVISQRQELIDWYLRRGYVLTKERKPFPYGQARFGLPLRDDLEFVVMRKVFE